MYNDYVVKLKAHFSFILNSSNESSATNKNHPYDAPQLGMGTAPGLSMDQELHLVWAGQGLLVLHNLKESTTSKKASRLSEIRRCATPT